LPGDRSQLAALATGQTGGSLRRAVYLEIEQMKVSAGDLLDTELSSEERAEKLNDLAIRVEHARWFLDWFDQFGMTQA